MGVPVFYADIEARQLYLCESVKNEVRQNFGSNVFDAYGEVDTKRLATIVFGDRSKLLLINEIIHPCVLRRYKEWLSNYRDLPYTMHESAILFENRLESHYDLIINVTAPPELRMARIMDRDGVEREKVEARMAHQLSEEEKNSRADFVITNDGKQLLIPQVLKIDKQIRKWKK